MLAISAGTIPETQLPRQEDTSGTEPAAGIPDLSPTISLTTGKPILPDATDLDAPAALVQRMGGPRMVLPLLEWAIERGFTLGEMVAWLRALPEQS